MIAELDQVFYKNVYAEQSHKWQDNEVSGNGYQGFPGILHPIDGMLVKHASAHQRASQQIT